MTKPTTPRPNYSSAAVCKDAAKLLLAKISRWLEVSGQPDDCLPTLKQIEDAIHYECDAYKIARQLEKTAGMEADVYLVELIASEIDTCKKQAADNLVKIWAKEQNLQPPPLGATITHKKSTLNGIITKNDTDLAQAKVRLINVRFLNPKDADICRIIPWEELIVVKIPLSTGTWKDMLYPYLFKNRYRQDAAWEGCLFETSGPEVEHVIAMHNKHPNRILTVTTDENKDTRLEHGMQDAHPIGYLISSVEIEPFQPIVINDSD